MSPVRKILVETLAAAFLALFGAGAAARADDAAACAIADPIPGRLMSESRVADYQSVLRACRGPGGAGLAIRAMRLDGEPALLLADPETLTTRLERAACWTCDDADESAFSETRLSRAIEKSAEAPGVARRTFLRDAGLTHGASPGAYVTGDLCPSRRPLDRAFFDELAAMGPRTPVALSISGLWLLRHFVDYRWLLERQADGALEITWVNHTYHHPYQRGVPNDHNFLLTPGVDPDEEILRTERLLIANGQTPSLFFRFPGLVSDAPLMQAARRHHLITLGADAWLALNQKPRLGSIVLVHPNGNEELGLRIFDRDLAAGAIPKPLEPLDSAPD
jgi:hypothetical protein